MAFSTSLASGPYCHSQMILIMDRSQNYALHFICITFHLHLKIMPRQHEMHDTSQTAFNANVIQNPFFNQFFAFFKQLLPCQVAILQHLRDVAKAL